MLRTRFSSGWNGSVISAMNCVGRRRISCDGIYELRATVRGRHYRVLYFFHRQVAIVVAHGLTKEKAVPPWEIDLAIRRKGGFEVDPAKHTLKEP
jgi:phage-related protein